MTPPAKGEGEKEKLVGINRVTEESNGEMKVSEVGQEGDVTTLEKAERSTREEERGAGGDLKPARGESQVHNDDGQLARSGNGQSRYTHTHQPTHTHSHTSTYTPTLTHTHILTQLDTLITRGLKT